MKQVLLWAAAIALMVAAIFYQRLTGPTYPFRGAIEEGGIEYKYRLIRSEETIRDASVILPDPGGTPIEATLNFKRFKTNDEITSIPLTLKDGEWSALIPRQPAAGKIEYFVEGKVGSNNFRIPEMGEENIIIRFKDPVPGYILWPHVVMMFFSVLIGMRAGLGALFDVGSMRRWALVSLIGMTIGGMVLGPFVQKYAFGEYWTGFPFGGDLTDNKMLIMWVAWLIAMAVAGLKAKKKETVSRILILIAAVVMTVVYMIPHSMRGSELDYSQIDKGIAPEDAIETGQ